MEAELDEVKNRTKRFEMIFAPIKSGKPDSPWMIITEGGYGAIQKALGKSEYVANEGVNTRGANAVFYVKILQAQGDLVMIRNDLEEGKTKYRESRRAVETSLVFPLLGGEDVKRWYCQSSDYILMPHDESSGTVIKEDTLKTQYWNAFRFLLDFQDALATRKFYGKSIKGKFPFYALFQVNTKTFSPYKVVWKSIAGRISGKPEFDSAVVTPIENGPLGAKVVIPNTTLVFIPFASPIEAFYCAAILNSSLMKLVVASYTIETRIPPNITENVFIPQFDSRNPLHQRLGELSESAHNSVREKKTGLKERLETVEREIDETVAKLYGITNKELAEVRMTLRILTEGEAGDKPVKIPSEYSSDIE